MHPAGKLRNLLKEPGPILCPGIYDCLSAKVVERAGLPCAIISGAAVTASRLGYPDVGLQTMSEILDQARNIARSVTIPVIADIDTGYGNALNVMRTISEFESAGLAGIFFEDQTFPKKCGHFEGIEVIPTEEMVIKIRAACEARQSKDFVLIARTDARGHYGLKEAIARGRAYAAAGADIIFIEALLSEADLREVGKSIDAPLQANIVEGGKTPNIGYRELHEMGFKLISYSGTLQRTAITGMLGALETLKKDGTTQALYPDRMCNLVDRSELLGLSRYYETEERLYGPIRETEGSWKGELQRRGKEAGK
ncbi:MAG: isocitrate lyase/PEP mutase family protein [Betaproteobacteria bacterium]|nr:isocitrate lyase/PEP mutase family protein [Betaproteobacteria bacterium]